MKNIHILIAAIVISQLCACKKETSFDASGTFESVETIVSAESNGRIVEFKLNESDRLEANAFVGKIDDAELVKERQVLLHQLNSSKANIPDIALQLAPLEEELAKQNFEKERTKKLLLSKSVNQKQLDDIEASIALITKQISALKDELTKRTKSIEENVKSLNAQIEVLDCKISKCKIINPIKGTVLVKYAQFGEFATLGKALYKIARTDELFVRAYFSADILSKIKLGQEVNVLADFDKDETRSYKGKITWISDKSEFTPKGIHTRNERADLVYAVKILVVNDGLLKIGQYAEINL